MSPSTLSRLASPHAENRRSCGAGPFVIKKGAQKSFERANSISARNPLKYRFGCEKRSLDEAFPMAKKIAWGVGYIVGVLTFILISCEIFLRFLIPNSQGYFVYPPHSVFRFVPDRVNTPGIEGISHFVVNSLGMRADEIPPDAKRRILVFGGSTAIDVYLDQTKMWSHLVQDKLNATTGQPKTWVGNIARPSLATIHNLLEFDRMLPSLPRMNMFINLVGVNDFQLALRNSSMRKLTLEDHLNWVFSVRPRRGWRNRLALYRFYARIKDWWKRSRNSVVLTEYATNFAKWRTCRQTAPKENSDRFAKSL